MTSQDMFGLVTGSTFSSKPPVSLYKKKSFRTHISPEIHHQLENPCKELFSTELHWEIFCCIRKKSRTGYKSKHVLTSHRLDSCCENSDFLFRATCIIIKTAFLKIILLR